MEDELEMPWIESHTEIERHRKVILMAADLDMPPVHLSGHLHALWHNVLEQQETGCLKDWPNGLIAKMAMYEGDADKFVNLMLKHGFLEPHMMLIHHWLDYVGKFLWRKYHSSNPAKLNEIEELYIKYDERSPSVRLKESTRRLGYLNNTLVINTKISKKILEESFEQFWEIWPKRVARVDALRAWMKLAPNDDLLKVILATVTRHNESWRREGTAKKHIPNPATWINGKRWNDEIDSGNTGRIKSNGAVIVDLAPYHRVK
jgi:hypothetical protein